MSCGSALCSQSQDPVLSPAAFPFPRTALPDIGWRDRLRAVWMSLRRLEERRRQRLALAELDDRLLADIGVSREQARREADRPFWR